jgi:peptidyl-prolyl cis-trans isomerase C
MKVFQQVRFRSLASGLMVLGLTGCNSPRPGSVPATSAAVAQQSPKDLGELVAQIDDVKITVSDLQERIDTQSPYIRARYSSLDRKKEFLDNLVRFEVLAKEAAARGMEKDPEVQRTLKQVMIQRLMQEEFDKKMKPDDVSVEEAKKFYQAHLDEYSKPEQARASAIVVGDLAVAKKVAAEAKAKKDDPMSFFALVEQYGQDPELKLRKGDLRYFGRDATDLPKEVVEKAFSLANIGDLSDPIKTAKGYYILKLTGHRAAINHPFEEVQKQLQNRIYREQRAARMEQFVAQLREKSKVRVFEDRLDKVHVEAAAAPATPAPSGVDSVPGHEGLAAPSHP